MQKYRSVRRVVGNLAFVVLAFSMAACGLSDADQLSTAVAKLSTESAPVATAMVQPTETAAVSSLQPDEVAYLAEFETRFAVLKETYKGLELLYNIASEDYSILSNATWKANMNAALDDLGPHVDAVAQVAPVPPAFEELDDTMGALSTATYFSSFSIAMASTTPIYR